MYPYLLGIYTTPALKHFPGCVVRNAGGPWFAENYWCSSRKRNAACSESVETVSDDTRGADQTDRVDGTPCRIGSRSWCAKESGNGGGAFGGAGRDEDDETDPDGKSGQGCTATAAAQVPEPGQSGSHDVGRGRGHEQDQRERQADGEVGAEHDRGPAEEPRVLEHVGGEHQKTGQVDAQPATGQEADRKQQGADRVADGTDGRPRPRETGGRRVRSGRRGQAVHESAVAGHRDSQRETGDRRPHVGHVHRPACSVRPGTGDQGVPEDSQVHRVGRRDRH